MRVCLLTHQWGHPWIKLFKQEFEANGHEYVVNEPGQADVYLHAWSDGSTHPVPGAKNIFFMRRFELYSQGWKKIDWRNVDKLITVNDWIADRISKYLPMVDIQTVYNAVGKWTYKERKPGKKIGMCGHVHAKKGFPLALQILAALPADYELHIAGEIQDQCIVDYIDHIARQTKRSVYLYGYIPGDQMDIWWEDKNFCLSTSVSEGNPNNVNEAMAKGIKPVVHNWMGAKEQYGEVFNTVEEAVNIFNGKYNSKAYRELVEQKFSINNIKKIVGIAEQLEVKKMKGNLELGINEQESISKDPGTMGLDNTGKDQKPKGAPAEKASKNGKNFTIK